MIRIVVGVILLLTSPAFAQRAAFTFFSAGTTPLSPTSFGTNLFRWFDASQYATNTPQVSGTILSNNWVDLAGNSNLTNVAGKQPSFFSNIFGSLPAIRFTNQNYLAMAEADIGYSGFTTVAVVTKNLVNPGFLVLSSSFSPNYQYLLNDQGDGFPNQNWYFPGSSLVLSTTISESITAARVNWCVIAQQAVSHRVNKTAYGSGTSATSQLRWNRVGADTANDKGDVGEIVVIQQALTTSQMDNLYDNYFKPKWGLP